MSEEMNMAQPEANESIATESTQNDTQIESTSQETKTETPQQQSFKVKHLHEEKEIPYEEAPTYIQKGLDYDRIKGKYEESKPVLSFVEKLAKDNGMSVPDYLKAVEEYQRQQEIKTLAQQRNLDPELANELYLLRQERQERETQKQVSERQAKENQEFIDFLTEYPDIKADDIPQEVWKTKAEKNISILDAYIRHERNQLKSKITAQETNSKNAEASTGSITGNGNTTSNYISKDAFEKNKGDRNWIMKNFEIINKSRSKW